MLLYADLWRGIQKFSMQEAAINRKFSCSPSSEDEHQCGVWERGTSLLAVAGFQSPKSDAETSLLLQICVPVAMFLPVYKDRS